MRHAGFFSLFCTDCSFSQVVNHLSNSYQQRKKNWPCSKLSHGQWPEAFGTQSTWLPWAFIRLCTQHIAHRYKKRPKSEDIFPAQRHWRKVTVFSQFTAWSKAGKKKVPCTVTTVTVFITAMPQQASPRC